MSQDSCGRNTAPLEILCADWSTQLTVKPWGCNVNADADSMLLLRERGIADMLVHAAVPLAGAEWLLPAAWPSAGSPPCGDAELGSMAVQP